MFEVFSLACSKVQICQGVLPYDASVKSFVKMTIIQEA